MAAIEGGGTLSEVYQSARKLLLRARGGIGRLERLESSGLGGGELDSAELSLAVKKDVLQIHSLCSSMDCLWRSIAEKSQRDPWKRKVEQVAKEADSLKDSLDKYSVRNERRMLGATERARKEARERELARKRMREEEEQLLFESALLCRQHENRERLKRGMRLMSDLCNRVGLPKLPLRAVRLPKTTSGRSNRVICLTILLQCWLIVATVIILWKFL